MRKIAWWRRYTKASRALPALRALVSEPQLMAEMSELN